MLIISAVDGKPPSYPPCQNGARPTQAIRLHFPVYVLQANLASSGHEVRLGRVNGFPREARFVMTAKGPIINCSQLVRLREPPEA